ncbi:MAG TPA: UDP-N-acetylmuramate--L-alanine ligase, partial [Firmicutes bacterium]|nr:UDP-N-acetylmuramate--L-alanine ligase [Bacillota bacterium]
GAEIGGLGIGGRLGKSKYLVAEADEAYGSFLEMYPTVAVVTNIDDDHLDYYGTMDNLVRAFSQFLSRVPQDGLAVLCSDCERALEAASGLAVRRVTYGLEPGADFTAVNPSISSKGSTFEVVKHGAILGRVSLQVPGKHNISNALACVAVAQELDIDWGATVLALERFRGAERRCQVIADVNDVLIIDDYAHHPTEIAATLAALKDSTNRRVIAVFQPQRYTRTKLLMPEFARAFSSADRIFVAEIYHEGTGETPIPGVSGSRLAEAIHEYERRPVDFVPDIEGLATCLVEIVRPGDLVVTMGAGDIWKLAYKLAERLRER